MSMDDPWKAGTWEGNRRLQQEEFNRLSFAEKLDWLEDMAEVHAALARAARRRRRLRDQDDR